MKPCELYVVYRAEGMTLTKAAYKAGFSKGAPSPKARRLWEAAQKVRRAPAGALEGYLRRLEEKRRQVREMELVAEALALIQTENGLG